MHRRFPIRRKVFLLTVALSLALITAAVFVSYALYSTRVRLDVEEGCQAAARNMADEIEEYHDEFLLQLQQEIDVVYRGNREEIEIWSYHYDDIDSRNTYFDILTADIFPAKGRLGLSYEKSLFLGNYNNLRAMLNVSSTGVGMQDAQVVYLDMDQKLMVHLVDSVTTQSPYHHPPGSISYMDDAFIAHFVDSKEPKPYSEADQVCLGACPVRIEGLDIPLYILFRDTLDEAYSHRNGFMRTVALVMAGATALLALVYLLFVDRFVAKNIDRLSQATQSFAAQLEQSGNLSPVPADIRTRDELGDLSGQLDLMQSKLVEYVQTIGEKTAQEESMRAELNLAARIQMESLPSGGFESEGCRIDTYLQPAREVGGDLYDFFMMDEDRLFFGVADVSGKGVPAALFMMRGKEVIKAQASAGHSPKEIAQAVNRELCRGNEEGLFITAFFGVLEVSRRRLTYARAGHEQPFLIRRGKAEQFSEESNFMLGLFDDFEFREDVLDLEPGDRILIFTDGLDEGINPRQEAFGYERIRAVLEKTPGNTLPALVEALARFSEGEEQFDDVTLLQLSLDAGREWHFENPDYSVITVVCDGLEEALQGLPQESRALFSMAADEVMNNCISYAYEGVEKPLLTVRLEQEGETLRLSFEDNGIPFNPLELDQRERLERDIIQRDAGGLGIEFVKTFSDRVYYEYREGRNCLTFEKNGVSGL